MSMSGVGGGRAIIPRDARAMNLEVMRLGRLRTAILIDPEVSTEHKRAALAEIDALVSTLNDIVQNKVP